MTTMTNGKPGVMLYFDLMGSLQHLSDKNAGVLFKGIMHYAREGKEPQLSAAVLPLWALIRSRVDADDAAYREKTWKNKYNAYVRWSKQKGVEPQPYETWLTENLPNGLMGS